MAFATSTTHTSTTSILPYFRTPLPHSSTSALQRFPFTKKQRWK